MGNSHDHDALRLNVEEYRVRESTRESATDRICALPLREGQRALRHGGDDPLDLRGELEAEARAPSFLPGSSLLKLVQRVCVDVDRQAHDAERRRRTRARASDQGTASTVPRWRRAWISVSHASSHSASAGPSTLSISSDAKRSLSAGSSAMASVVTTCKGWDIRGV